MSNLASPAVQATFDIVTSLMMPDGPAAAGNARGKHVLKKAVRLLLGTSVPASALFACGTAWAQDASAAAQPEAVSAEIGEIIVTAQFREQKLQDTPIAITAVNGAMLEARSQTNLADVAAQAPSVTLRSDTAQNGPSVVASIRGMGQFDPNAGLEPGVGIYIDDVYYPRLTGANFDLLDVDRVEILRGPQGTLTGRNSEGGAIKFFSRKPDGSGGGYVSATYGSRNRIGLRGSADFTIAQGLFGRVSGAFADQDGYVKQIDYGCANPGSGVTATRPAGDCTISKWGDVGYRAVKGIIRYNPSDTIDAMISADYVRDKRNNPAEVLLYANNPDPNANAAPGVPLDSRFICGRYCNYAANGQPAGTFAGLNPLTFTPQDYPVLASAIDNAVDYKGGGVSGHVEIGLSDTMQLTSISAYREFKTLFSSDIDLSPANAASNRNANKSRFWSQELRLNAQLAGWADLTVGGYYSHEKTSLLSQQDNRTTVLFPLQFVADDKVKVTSKALFGTVILHPTEALTITGGLRYTKETKDFTFARYNFDGVTVNQFTDPGGLLTGTTVSYRGSRWDYRISADYRFSPEVLAYATVSTGFKGGGVNPRPFLATQAQPFNPEKLTAFEVGLKTDLFDRRLRLNLSAYYNKFKDAQVQLSSCPQYNPPGVFFAPCALPANAGDADIKGIEAEIFFRPVDGLQIDASGSILDWNWKCVDPQTLGLPSTGACLSSQAIIDQVNAPPTGVAKTQWSIGAQYEIGLGTSGSLTPRIDVVYQGKVNTVTPKAAPGSPSALLGVVNSYTLANARLTWRNADEDLDISLEVTNIFDKYYSNFKWDAIPLFYGTINASVGRPREWAVTVKKKF